MKCGTTSLFELLAQHPAICPCREKEPDFFAQDAGSAGAWDAYLRLWNWDPQRHQVALEASAAYAKYPWVKGVPERIAAVQGCSFRFIYMMREPAARIASQVRHGVYDGWGKSLDEAMTEDLIDFSKYAMQLDRYTALFPREHILPITLDELSESPEVVLERVCRFLGVSPDYQFHDAKEARNRGEFFSVRPSVASLAKNRVAKGLVTSLLPRGVRRRLRQWLTRYAQDREGPIGRWELNEQERRLVRELLEEDLTRLRNHYGVEAPWLPAESTIEGAD